MHYPLPAFSRKLLPMKVEGPLPPKVAGVRRKGAADSVSGGSFASALEDESAAAALPAGLSGTSASAAVSTILALQGAEAEEGDAAKSRAKSRAEELLRKLDLLRLDLLDGGIPRAHLIDLAQAVKTVRTTVMDPRLAEILDEVDLRAQIELAKYDPYR